MKLEVGSIGLEDEQQPESIMIPPCSRITLVEIQRLHNLGNYSSVRYTVHAEIQPGDNPNVVISELSQALNDLHAQSGHSKYDYDLAQNTLTNGLTRFGSVASSEDKERAQVIIREYEHFAERRRQAHLTLARYNGETAHVDHKEKWEDCDNEEECHA